MNALWVDASRCPRIPGTPVHASALTPIIFLVLHISWFTLGLVLFVTVGVVYLTVRRLSLMWAVRMFKSKLRGNRVSARPLMYRRRCLLSRSYGECDMSEFR